MDLLLHNVKTMFEHRAIMEGKKRGIDYGVELNTYIDQNKIWFDFISTKDKTKYSITVPIPYTENGITLINNNEVVRAVNKYYIKNEDKIIEYKDVIHSIICKKPTGFIKTVVIKKSIFLQQIIYSFNNNNTAVIVYNLQKAINEIINKFPLHTTNLNSWVMNNRLIVIDEEFDKFKDPMKVLNYQINKAITLFDKGWTPVGLSDSAMADKNYMLTENIQKLTPFGLYYHNPQRNLYSTLGMQGDENPIIKSRSAQNLIDKGISRTGWNFFTLFVDIPEVFKDQILIDKSHRNKFTIHTSKIQCFGLVLVKEGDELEYDQVIEINNKVKKYFNIICDKAVVIKKTIEHINVGNVQTTVTNVTVEYKRYFKDGLKLTNTHGNKGVIRLKDLGYAIHPITKLKTKIDLIVSAKSIKKRKNYGQLLEALLNNLNNNKKYIVSDNFKQELSEIINRVTKDGFINDGKWECDIYVGKVYGVCGKIFWGAIKDVESGVWSKTNTTKINNKGIRVSGLKFSSIEFKALKTRFGENNPITKEILTYNQGKFIISEQLKILKSKIGEFDNTKEIIHIDDIKGIDSKLGSIVSEYDLYNTIADDCYYPNGFMMLLPVTYQIILNNKGKILHEGNTVTYDVAYTTEDETPAKIINIDKIYIPKGIIRKSWKHSNGNYGLNSLTSILNNLININLRYKKNTSNAINLSLLYKTIAIYFKTVTNLLCGKKGDISIYGMSVRYPNSVKGVATLSSSLEKNTVEIHKSMAKQLKVKEGDIVLVERFPCLGFMSLRPQKIKITHNSCAKYTIKVSGNSLISLGLDFDGDVIYLASFHTKEAKKALQKEWETPNKYCYDIISKVNLSAGEPHISCLGLSDYNIKRFNPLTIETQTSIVSKLAGVKLQTGPVIALVYNLLRILENTSLKQKQRINTLIEEFMDKVANSVFAQKHGTVSLHEVVTDSIYTNKPNNLIKNGFNEEISKLICNLIKTKAKEIGINNLEKYDIISKTKGKSNVVSLIIKKQNKIYFASRSKLKSLELLECLNSKSVDLPSKLFKKTMAYKLNLKEIKNKLIYKQKSNKIKTYKQKYNDISKTLQYLITKIIEG